MLRALNINNKYIVDSDLIKKISNFLYSDYYFLTIISFVVLMWGLGLIAPNPCLVIGISVILIAITFILIIQRDILPIIPLIFMVMCTITTTKMPSYIWIDGVLGGFIALAVIFHVVYYGLEEFKFGKMFFPMFLFLIASLLGGVGSKLPQSVRGNLLGTLLLALAPIFIYLMAVNYIDREKEVAKYIAKSAVAFGVCLVLELGMYYLFKPESLYNVYGVPHLGFGISNTIATYFLITIPMCFYMYVKEDSRIKGYIYLLFGIAQFVSIFLTTSRGGALFGTLEFVIMSIVTIVVVDKKKRIEYFIFAGVMLVLAGAMFGLLFDRIKAFLKMMFSDGMNDSGRFELYREAIACFFERPIFGVGLGYQGKMTKLINTVGVYMFHNTILQYVACLGLVGLCAYAYLYFARLEILFETTNKYSLFMLMMFIGFEGYSLLNTGTVDGFPDGLIVMLLYAAQEIDTKQNESKIYSVLLNKLKRNGSKLDKKQVAFGG